MRAFSPACQAILLTYWAILLTFWTILLVLRYSLSSHVETCSSVVETFSSIVETFSLCEKFSLHIKTFSSCAEAFSSIVETFSRNVFEIAYLCRISVLHTPPCGCYKSLAKDRSAMWVYKWTRAGIIVQSNFCLTECPSWCQPQLLVVDLTFGDKHLNYSITCAALFGRHFIIIIYFTYYNISVVSYNTSLGYCFIN